MQLVLQGRGAFLSVHQQGAKVGVLICCVLCILLLPLVGGQLFVVRPAADLCSLVLMHVLLGSHVRVVARPRME